MLSSLEKKITSDTQIYIKQARKHIKEGISEDKILNFLILFLIHNCLFKIIIASSYSVVCAYIYIMHYKYIFICAYFIL